VTRAVVYGRISDDPEGERVKVDDQLTDTTGYCERQGWEVVAQLRDDDISASRYSRKRRPGYAEAIRMIEAGEAEALVGWNLDRLWRQPKELEHLIDLVENRNVIVATLTGKIDLRTGDGRFQARTLVSVAAMESDKISMRTRRGKERAAAAGKGSGGGRPFGYDVERLKNGRPAGTGVMHVAEAEAALVMEAAERVLAGDSLLAIERDWKVRGVHGVTGSAWRQAHIGAMLRSPRIAGLREHRGEVVGPAAWPAILDRDTWERVRSTLGRGGPGVAHARSYLLTGFVRCGRCEALLAARPCRGVRGYFCSKDKGGCNGLRVTANSIDKFVTDKVLESLASPQFAEAVAEHDSAAPAPANDVGVEISAAEAKLNELAVDYAEGTISRGEWLAARAAIERRLDLARQKLAAERGTNVLAALPTTIDDLAVMWAELSLDRQRAVIAAVVDRVTVAPAPVRGRHAFDPARVTVEWKA
jgi:DNA invertase Pin-like site-specific DNA recombinase